MNGAYLRFLAYCVLVAELSAHVTHVLVLGAPNPGVYPGLVYLFVAVILVIYSEVWS